MIEYFQNEILAKIPDTFRKNVGGSFVFCIDKLILPPQPRSYPNHRGKIDIGDVVLNTAKIETFVGTQIDVQARLDVEIFANEKLVGDPSPKIGAVDIFTDTRIFLFDGKGVHFEESV